MIRFPYYESSDKMNLYKTGKFICELRNEKKLSQRALAEIIPLTRQAVSSWETGKSFPDSDVLKILANIFNVTTDELIAGERLVNNEQIESIKLDLVDEVNNKNKTIKSNIKIFSIIIGLLLLSFFAYYFLTSYNTIRVYKISGEKDNIFTENGILIATKQKTYLRIGNITSKEKIKNVKLYYIKSNKKQIIYNNENTDILITEFFGYNEFFSYKDLKFIIKSLELEITDENNAKETIKLNVKKDFSNNLLLYKKEFNLSNYDKLTQVSEDNYFTEAVEKLKEIGIKNDKAYIYKSKDNKIKLSYINNELILESLEQNKREIWIYYIDYNNSFLYQKFLNDEEKENRLISLKDFSKLSKEDNEKYLRLKKYIKNYLLD